MFGHLGPVCILLECMSYVNPLWDIKTMLRLSLFRLSWTTLGISGQSRIFMIFGLFQVIWGHTFLAKNVGHFGPF